MFKIALITLLFFSFVLASLFIYLIYLNRKESVAFQILKLIKREGLVSLKSGWYMFSKMEDLRKYEFKLKDGRRVEVERVYPSLDSLVYSKVTWSRYHLRINYLTEGSIGEDTIYKERLFKYIERLHKQNKSKEALENK